MTRPPHQCVPRTGADLDSSGSHTATKVNRSRSRRSVCTCAMPMPRPTTAVVRSCWSDTRSFAARRLTAASVTRSGRVL